MRNMEKSGANRRRQLDSRAFPGAVGEPMNCANCNNPFKQGDDAYQIERGRIEFDDINGELVFACGSNPCTTYITLCADCYDDNWLIGEPLPKNRLLVDG